MYCRQHTQDGMVNVSSKCCAHEGCIRQPSFSSWAARRGHTSSCTLKTEWWTLVAYAVPMRATAKSQPLVRSTTKWT